MTAKRKGLTAKRLRLLAKRMRLGAEAIREFQHAYPVPPSARDERPRQAEWLVSLYGHLEGLAELKESRNEP